MYVGYRSVRAVSEAKSSRPNCPACGGESVKVGFRITRSGRKQRYQCKACGKTFYAYNIDSTAKISSGRVREESREGE